MISTGARILIDMASGLRGGGDDSHDRAEEYVLPQRDLSKAYFPKPSAMLRGNFSLTQFGQAETVSSFSAAPSRCVSERLVCSHTAQRARARACVCEALFFFGVTRAL